MASLGVAAEQNCRVWSHYKTIYYFRIIFAAIFDKYAIAGYYLIDALHVFNANRAVT